MTYNGNSTSNKPLFYYGKYTGTTLKSVAQPYMHSSPSGTIRAMNAAYPALSGGKSSVGKPFKGYITLVGCWDMVLSSSDVSDLFGSGTVKDFANTTGDQPLCFHDMDDMDENTMYPDFGGDGYTLNLNNGVTQNAEVPS